MVIWQSKPLGLIGAPAAQCHSYSLQNLECTSCMKLWQSEANQWKVSAGALVNTSRTHGLTVNGQN